MSRKDKVRASEIRLRRLIGARATTAESYVIKIPLSKTVL